MITESLYTPAFAELAHRAARLGCYIAVDDPRPGDAGPYVLRFASFDDGDGYDAHGDGCDLEMIEIAIRQIEVERAFVERFKSWDLDAISKDKAVAVLLENLDECAPPDLACLKANYDLPRMASEAWDRARDELREAA
jgi:hypothetical protein